MNTPNLFKKIEELHGEAPWGHVLDAGTGPKSLAWIATLPTQCWTAVSAQRVMVQSARQALSAPPREADRIIHGNWADETLLVGERFDTVLLDHLVGAVDAFAPYFQETLLQHMASRMRGALYITGLEPYVPVVADDEVGVFVGDLGRLRDACMLLARERPYREYPAVWVAAQLHRSGLKVIHIEYLPIRYRGQFLASQLQICEDRINHLADAALATSLRDHITRMRYRGEDLIARHDGLPYGSEYVLRAVLAK